MSEITVIWISTLQLFFIVFNTMYKLSNAETMGMPVIGLPGVYLYLPMSEELVRYLVPSMVVMVPALFSDCLVDLKRRHIILVVAVILVLLGIQVTLDYCFRDWVPLFFIFKYKPIISGLNAIVVLLFASFYIFFQAIFLRFNRSITIHVAAFTSALVLGMVYIEYVSVDIVEACLVQAGRFLIPMVSYSGYLGDFQGLLLCLTVVFVPPLLFLLYKILKYICVKV